VAVSFIGGGNWSTQRRNHRPVASHWQVKSSSDTTGIALIINVTKVVSLNPAHGEVYSIQHYMIKCVSELW